MILIAIGLLSLAIGLQRLLTRDAAGAMRDEERRTGRETSVPLFALGLAYVMPVVGLLLVVVGILRLV
jgi:uncharacterized membrane protein YidH (DUF202 family)